MPIRSLLRTEARLPEIAILHKGGPKNWANPKTGKTVPVGRDLDYFRLTSDRPEVEAKYYDTYGVKPSQLDYAYLLAATPEAAFSFWQEEWGAGSLKHRCDGEYVVRWLDPKTGRFEDYPERGRMRCPGGCQRVGRLSVLLRGLGLRGTVCLQTSSIHDILHIQEQLNALYGLAQVHPEHRSGSLLGIPLCIRRDPKQISVPVVRNGQHTGRTRMVKSLISIEAMAEWFEPTLAQLQAAATPEVPALATVTVRSDSDVSPRSEQPYDIGHAPDGIDDEDEGDYREIDETTGEILDPATVTGPSGDGGGVVSSDSAQHEVGGERDGGEATDDATPASIPPASPTPLPPATPPQRRQLRALAETLNRVYPSEGDFDHMTAHDADLLIEEWHAKLAPARPSGY